MLNELMAPKSIAVVGASRTPGKVGHEILANLLNGGFQGKLLPIALQAGEILGLRCHKSLRDTGEKIDLGIIAVPVPAVKAAVEECIEAGAKALVVITAGFKEVGPQGLEMENQIAKICRARQVRMLGPNCIGVVNPQHQMNATFAPVLPPRGSISIISQSGALCVALLDWAAGRKLGLGKVVSLGNKADLNETDFLQAFAEDPDTRVIMGYLESIQDGRRFLEVAEETAHLKPVILLKSGVTESGAKAASSHTGSLAGADMAYGAAFLRAGVIRAPHLETLFDHAQAFAGQPLPAGNRLTILTNAGGVGILAADAAEPAGFRLAAPTAGALKKLQGLLPASAAFGNPVDVIGDAEPDRFVGAFEVMQQDDNTDAILFLVTPQNMTRPLELAQKLAKAHRGAKPLLTAFIGGEAVRQAVDFLSGAGIPNYNSPERAVHTLKAMLDYAVWRQRPTRVAVRFPVNRHRAERILNWQRRMRLAPASEVEAKEILKAYGFRILAGSLARDVDSAVEVARQIGFPVVMKIVSPDVIHKSDMGGVHLNLANADQVRDAFDVIMARVKRLVPRARVRGVYVEQMGRRGREVILGMTRDPQFGPMLMFGLGGIFVEVMKDVSFHISPITEDEALLMLKSTRSYALLRGARGQQAVDLAPLVEGLQRLSQLATDYPDITELDINPFIVTEISAESYVADARMTVTVPNEPV
jgi:acetyl coenzyme A synthetase (ADP forming)-like protein